MDKQSKKIKEIFARSKRRKFWIMSASFLAFAVVLTTVHFLILPAATMEKYPICGLEEHQHVDSCYKDEKHLVCQIPESDSHKHTEECYKIERILICDKKEHVHTADCFEQADLKADKESQEDWKRSVASAKLNGKWAHDIAEIAKTQIDYKESNKNFVYGSNGEKKGYTRYGDWFGNKYADWNTMFVSFCLNYANIPQDIIPYKGTSDIKEWTTALKKQGLYKTPEKLIPESGDLLFLDTDKDGIADEVAVVDSVKSKKAGEGKVTAIKGNHNNKVDRQSYSLKDKKVTGFGKLGLVQNLKGELLNSTRKTETGTYWKRIKEESEIVPGSKYIIVSAQGNYALKNTNSNVYYYASNKTPVTIHSIKGNPDYYKIDGVIAENKLDFNNTLGKKYFSNGNYKLDMPYRLKLFMNNDGRNTVFKKSYLEKKNDQVYAGDGSWTGRPDSCWDISVSTGSTPVCLNFEYMDKYFNNYQRFSDYTFIGKDENLLNIAYSSDHMQNYHYNRTQNMLIFKECPNTTLTIPDDAQLRPEDGGGGTAIKPKYPAYVNTSNAMTGSYTDANGSKIDYFSDPSTSKIESLFGYHPVLSGQNDYEAQLVDNGKAMTDKSVIYKKDDYKAFNDYKDGEFSVTLSALGQVFDINKGEVKVPIDVLFILDVSNSMNEKDKNQSKTRAQILTEAMNVTIDKILKAHPANRICAVGFNSASKDLLPMSRPTPVPAYSNNYLRYERGSYDSTYREYHNKIIVTSTNELLVCNHGTFTQRGIAQGYELMTKNKDTTYKTTIGGEEVVVPRKPVIILVSDGEPTHGTNFYMDPLNSPVYGDGLAQEINAKGIIGYYTILSANYFKRMVGIHYDTPADMYTLAFGMKEKDTTMQGASHGTNHLKATVMKPSEENINYLNTIYTSRSDVIEKQLYSLLKGSFNSHYVKVSATFSQPNIPYPCILLPVNTTNPYRGNYNYADKAFLNNSRPDDIASAFQQIIDASAVKTIEYSYETISGIPINIKDPVGEGMELKSDPILRLNGKNYVHTSKNVQGNTITYHYNYGKVPMDNYSNKKIDTNTIVATVVKDGAGNQTVNMNIPAPALPIYIADKTLSFFYEALPARLIYKVGLSQQGQNKIDSLAPGQTATFYTNRYTGGQHAEGVIRPTNENNYYSKAGWQENKAKTSNTTGTDGHSIIVGGNKNDVRQNLGNNGKLVVTKTAAVKKDLSVQKKWLDYNGKETTEKLPEKITATLYRTYTNDSGKVVREDVLEFTLDAKNGWKKTFTYSELKETPGRDYLYYVNEHEVEGYKVSYQGDGVESNTPETPIVITNRYKYGDLILPSTGGPGTVIMTIAGLALISTALGYGYVLKRRKKKGDCK